jgi:TolB-like protein
MRLRVLGGLDLLSDAGAPAQDVTRQTRLMLACLGLAGTKGLTRSQLCQLFWPDRPSTQARNSLRQALAAIRKTLSGGAAVMSLESDLEVVRLSAHAGAIDVRVFRHGWQKGDRESWIAAANAYGGELLAGVKIMEDIEPFVASHRRSLGNEAQVLVERLSQTENADGESLKAAQALAERLLQYAPASEEAHRALMRVHLQHGRINGALRQFEQCRAALFRELSVEPDVETRQLLASIQSSRINVVEEAPITDADGRTATGSGDHPSIAVMPFDNLGEPSDEYFADGVVEEITLALSRIRDFFVIARQSTFAFKGRFVDAKEVGHKLGVTYLVVGTVRRSGERLRISVQLIDAADRTLLWSDRYEGGTGDIFAFQDQIAAQVAGTLKPVVRQAEIDTATRKPPTRLKAHDLVMCAFPKLLGHNAAAINKATSILEDALRIDPRCGRAKALLAWCHALRVTFLWTTAPERETDAARRAVDAATGLIDDDPTALTAVGAATGFCGDLDGASTILEQALALDPNNAWAWTRLGWIGIYGAQPERALGWFEKAMKLSPLDPFTFNARLGMACALSCSGRVEEAVAIAKDVTKKYCEVTWAHRLLASWAATTGDMATAQSAARKLMAASPDFTIRRYLRIPAFQNFPEYRERMAQGMRYAGLPEG